MAEPISFQVWSRASGNRLGEYVTKSAALETVRIIIDADPSEIGTLVILESDADGHLKAVALEA